MSIEHQAVPRVYRRTSLGYHAVDGPRSRQCTSTCARIGLGLTIRSGSLLQL